MYIPQPSTKKYKVTNTPSLTTLFPPSFTIPQTIRETLEDPKYAVVSTTALEW